MGHSPSHAVFLVNLPAYPQLPKLSNVGVLLSAIMNVYTVVNHEEKCIIRRCDALKKRRRVVSYVDAGGLGG